MKTNTKKCTFLQVGLILLLAVMTRYTVAGETLQEKVGNFFVQGNSAPQLLLSVPADNDSFIFSAKGKRCVIDAKTLKEMSTEEIYNFLRLVQVLQGGFSIIPTAYSDEMYGEMFKKFLPYCYRDQK